MDVLIFILKERLIIMTTRNRDVAGRECLTHYFFWHLYQSINYNDGNTLWLSQFVTVQETSLSTHLECYFFPSWSFTKLLNCIQLFSILRILYVSSWVGREFLELCLFYVYIGDLFSWFIVRMKASLKWGFLDKTNWAHNSF